MGPALRLFVALYSSCGPGSWRRRDRRWIAIALIAVASMIGGQAAAAAAPFEMKVPVLMYHRIACTRPDGTYSSLFVCPARLGEHMAAVKAAGWQSITTDQLLAAMQSRTCLRRKTFVITVDDGALDGYENGAPIWEAHGFRASFYMVVGKAGDYLTKDGLQKPHFSWDQARDLIARGHAIGNHTWTHVSVETLGDTKWQNQIVRSQDKLEAELGFRPNTFVYPYGSYSFASAERLKAEFGMAFTTEAGGKHSTDRMMLSPRVRVSRSTSAAELLDKMRPYRRSCVA